MSDFDDKELTPKEELFVNRYVVDFNGAAACRDVGYSEHTAKEIAAELLTKPHIHTPAQEFIAVNAFYFKR